MQLVTLPTESLRERSVELTRETLLSAEIQSFITEMIPKMYEEDGIGLAAPQVGKNLRICVIGKEATPDKKTDLVLVNPQWEKTSRRHEIDVEGCLSVPKIFGKVKRSSEIHVTALDRYANPLSFDAKHFFARVIQHEVDHLNGILFIDKARDIYSVEEDSIQSKKTRPTGSI